jgi:hypothetical protein
MVLIGSHLLIFWYFPLNANYALYENPVCDPKTSKNYGCKSFEANGYLRIFYILYCIYLYYSAMQISSGLPIYR